MLWYLLLVWVVISLLAVYLPWPKPELHKFDWGWASRILITMFGFTATVVTAWLITAGY